jgi:arylsulfatase
MVDDVGWADFSYSNEGTAFSTVIPTPHIDALASRGIKLKNYYVHPSCTPTRAAFLTGLYSPNTGLTVVRRN